MVPVRGGSRGVPRKNARILGGKPMMGHVLTTLKSVDSGEQVFVVTDDDELEAIARQYDVRVFKLPPQTGKETLDDKALELLPALKKQGAKPDDIFLTIQATCPFVKAETIRKAKKILEKKSSVITVMDDRHLAWKLDAKGEPTPAYEKRVNRQSLPAFYRESGAVIGARIQDIAAHKTRIVEPIGILPIDKEEGLDIDDFTDWAAAEHILSRTKIFIRADAGKKLGMGHVYRALAVAQEYGRHRPQIYTSTAPGKELGAEFFAQHPFDNQSVVDDAAFTKIVKKEKPALVILDQLDTDSSYVKALKSSGAKVVTFEDMGDGALEADFLISDLYENPAVPRDKQLSGVNYAILSPAFENMRPREKINKTVEHILVLFGGSDPANLAEKSLKALSDTGFKGFVTVVQGLGRKDRIVDLKAYKLKGEVLTNVSYMPEIIKRADLALSSAGRTITELMVMGVPTLCVCQNEKELNHTHATRAYGVVNLGLGTLLGHDTLVNNILFLLDNYEFRKHMNTRARHALELHSNQKVLARMAEKLGMVL